MSKRPGNPAMTIREHSHNTITFEAQTTKMILDDWVPLSVIPKMGGGWRVVYCRRWVLAGPPPDDEPVASRKRARKPKGNKQL